MTSTAGPNQHALTITPSRLPFAGLVAKITASTESQKISSTEEGNVEHILAVAEESTEVRKEEDELNRTAEFCTGSA